MNIYPMSDKAKEVYEASEKREPNVLAYDLRCKYPFFKLNVGQAFAFESLEYDFAKLRKAASAYGLRNGCRFACFRHGDNILEVARIG